jgi:hypothetical protein
MTAVGTSDSDDVRVQAGLKTNRFGRYGQPAVKWLSVRQLVRTGQEVALGTLFARFADKREAMAGVPGPLFALPEHDRVRVDYTADTGDGFDATFAVARLLASGQPALDPQTQKLTGPPAGRASLLILGGDEVYPVASANAYRQRFVRVFKAASLLTPAATGQPPFMLALPGNHDWYDGLTAFRRTFCESWARDAGVLGDTVTLDPSTANDFDQVGDWLAPQTRSYFAIQVQPHWWVWGIDSQLDAPIDAVQLHYFQRAKQKLKPDDGLVLCTATPCWLEAAGETPPKASADTPISTLTWFLRRVLGPGDAHQLRLVLTGDKHHYVRYEPDPDPSPDDFPTDEFTAVDGPPLVTCGGGGAFTSSTHHLPPQLTVPWRRPAVTNQGGAKGRATRYTRGTSYPCKDQSKQMRRVTWALGWRNGPFFPVLLGLAQLGLFAAMLRANSSSSAGSVVAQRPAIAWVSVVALLVVLCLFAATGIRGSVAGRWRRWGTVLLAGGLHTALQCAVPAVGAFVLWPDHSPPSPYLWPAYVGFVIPATLQFSCYLRVCEHLGFHELESFSSQHSERYKCLLRMTFTDDQVAVVAVGLDSVPASRRKNVTMTAASSPQLDPHVIDTFTVTRSRHPSR